MTRNTRYLFPVALSLIASLMVMLTVTQTTNIQQHKRIHTIVLRDTQIKIAESLDTLRVIREYLDDAPTLSEAELSDGLHDRYANWQHKFKSVADDLISQQPLHGGSDQNLEALNRNLSVINAADHLLQSNIAKARMNILAMHEAIDTTIDTASDALHNLQYAAYSRDQSDAKEAMAAIAQRTKITFWYFIAIILASVGLSTVTWKQNAAIRRIAEKARTAEQRNALFAAAIEAAPIGIVISDPALPDNPVIFINQSYTNITGFSRDEAIGRNCRILQGIHTDKETARILSAKVKAQKAASAVILNYRKDGTQFWNDLKINPVFNKAGKLTNFIAMQSDITAIRATQEDLIRAKEQAERATHVKSNFMAMISHEIRTPINGILGTLSLLQDTSMSQEQAALINTTLSSGATLMTLINDMLDFSKMEAGKLTLETTGFDLHEMVTSTTELMQSNAKIKNLNLTVSIDPTLPRYVLGDPTRMRQILLNLITNAIKFTSIGSITVTATSLLHSETDQGKKCIARFEIIDTGIGISHEGQTHLFTEFNQLDASITRRYGGTGLGLAICKRLVTLMGGEIGAESRLGIGSKFWFVLPLHVTETCTVVTSAALPLVAQRNCGKILVVEDNPTNQMLLAAMLRKDGHQVVVVENGLAGLTAIQTHIYDLVYMDVSMPVMDGLTATQQVRALGGNYATLPIVAMTALAMPGDREKCLAAGMNGFISKPVDRKLLSHETWKWLGVPTRTVASPSRHDTLPQIQTTTTLAICDRRILAEIADGIGYDVVRDMINVFTADFQARQQMLSAAISRADWLGVAHESHALKSSSASCGLMQFATLMKDIEFASKTGETEQVTVLAAQIDPAAKAAQAALHQAQIGFAGD
jgi:hypothetical protein